MACPSQSDSSSSPEGEVFPEIDRNVSKTCKLRIDDSVLQNILQLTHKSAIQVVKLAVFVIYSMRNGTRESQELKWAWANEVGGTIISLIAQTSSLRPYYHTLIPFLLGSKR